MSTTIIEQEKGYGFTLTAFSGGKEIGMMYQVNQGNNSIALTAWQMIQLLSAFLLYNNQRGMAGR